ncbi:hypothetical protein CCP4SC76_2630001 [Gammaproteobacteria bacterium]
MLELCHIGLGFMFLLASNVFAADRILDATELEHAPVSLTGYFGVLEDAGLGLTLADVLKPEINSQFRTDIPHGESLHFGFTSSAYWLRLNLQNRGNHAIEGMLEIAATHLASIQFHQPVTNQHYQTIETGYLKIFSERPYKNRYFVFPLTLPAHADQIYYLRILTPDPLEVPAFLWERSAFHAHERLVYVGLACYFGAAMAMLIYNFFLFLILRDIEYLLYLAFAATMVLVSAAYAGIAPEFLWGNSPAWTKISTMFLLSVTI